MKRYIIALTILALVLSVAVFRTQLRNLVPDEGFDRSFTDVDTQNAEDAGPAPTPSFPESGYRPSIAVEQLNKQPPREEKKQPADFAGAADPKPVPSEKPAEPEPVQPAEQQKQVFTPAPLTTNEQPAPKGSTLSADGIVLLTNQERKKRGLDSLAYNVRLERAAQIKLQDMFDRQYFAHNSPTGAGPGDIAEQAGYTYILVGENLALGGFANNAEMVAAWMASTGHRENILKRSYAEIGVAVGKGEYRGREVWMGVQEFGTPLSACPSPDEDIQKQIADLNGTLNTMAANLEEKKAALDAQASNPDSDYNQKVDAYNALVNAYNELVIESKALVNTYNNQANAFNSCMAKYKQPL